MSKRATIGELLKMVRSEIRQLWLLEQPAAPLPPPPHDLQAEQTVLSAVLSDQLRALPTGLGARAFFDPLHRAIWAVMLAAEEMDVDLTLDRLAWVLVDQGAQPERDHERRPVAMQGVTEHRQEQLLGMLEQLRDEVPWCIDILDQVARLMILYRRRRTLSIMQQLDMLWRADTDPPPMLLGDLRELLSQLDSSEIARPAIARSN